MREILFRGKRQDNGMWVEGSFVKYTDYDGDKVYLIYASNGNPNNIIPETVGQFTGLIDLNGKKIFEGDIVKISAIADIEETTGQVVVNNGAYCVFISTNQNPKNQPLLYWLGSSRIEVIGNIHDQIG